MPIFGRVTGEERENTNPINERTPLIRVENSNEEHCFKKCLIPDYYHSFFEFTSWGCLFFGHAIAVIQPSGHYIPIGILDISGAVMMSLYAINTNNIIPVVFMFLWSIIGFTQIINYHGSNHLLNNTSLFID